MENKTKNKFWVLLTAIFIAQLYLASALTISSVSSSPGEVQPGERFSLDLKIENDLEKNIENVIVRLDLSDINPITGETIYPVPFAPYQSSNEVTIETIDEGDDERASFDLIAFSDATSGTYNIPVQVSYTEIGEAREKDIPLGLVSVIVNAKPKIEVSSEGEVLIKGTNRKVSVKAINSGLGDAKFLSISINQAAGLQTTGSNKIYIGNIDSNDFDTADFNVFVSADAPSSINLPVQLTYTDSRNNEITENKVIFLNTYTAKEATDLGLISRNSTFVIILSIIGVIVLFLIYRRIRKRNRSKRNGQ